MNQDFAGICKINFYVVWEGGKLMTVKGRKTATYKIIKKEYGNIYQFYCDISGALVKETIPYKRKEPEEELEAAWEFEGKDCFNKCHKCGRWVMDVMYNPDTHNCVLCSPIEDIPDFCPRCGAQITGLAVFCHNCGVRLMYGGDDDEKDG